MRPGLETPSLSAAEAPRWRSVELVQYTAFSATALVLDYAVYWFLMSRGALGAGQAAALGYGAGLALAYVLMSRHVFRNGWLSRHRAREAALFAFSGLLGAGLSYGVAEAFMRAVAPDMHGAKASATAVSFVAVYAFRKRVVFRDGRG